MQKNQNVLHELDFTGKKKNVLLWLLLQLLYLNSDLSWQKVFSGWAIWSSSTFSLAHWAEKRNHQMWNETIASIWCCWKLSAMTTMWNKVPPKSKKYEKRPVGAKGWIKSNVKTNDFDP